MTNEIHYLTYDPEAMWAEMMRVYAEEGGELLYGGDEKEILLRAVLSIVLQMMAAVDTALLMSTLRYAVRDYLKIYGEDRSCPYNEATYATGIVAVRLKSDGIVQTIGTGTMLTADGHRYYQTTSDIFHTGDAQTVHVEIRCLEAGVAGNGLPVGTLMKMLVANASVIDIAISKEPSGGVQAEDEEAYRERIRMSGMLSSTTGPREQYEAVAMAASTGIVDVVACRGGDGIVDVNLLLDEGADPTDTQKAVADALNDERVRPLTDTVNINLAETKEYYIEIGYEIESPLKSDEGERQLRAAADAYIAWQNNKIGRAFDHNRLVASLYSAGAARVVVMPSSEFDGGALEYTPIDAYTHCSGSVELEVLQP